MTDETTPTPVHRVTLLVINHGDVTREMIERATPEELLAGARHVAPPPSEPALSMIANGLRVSTGTDPSLNYYDGRDPAVAASVRRDQADLRAIAGALYAKLLQTARRLGQHENTAALELDLAKVHVELGKLGVV